MGAVVPPASCSVLLPREIPARLGSATRAAPPPPATPRMRTLPCVLSWHLARRRAERDPISPRAGGTWELARGRDRRAHGAGAAAAPSGRLCARRGCGCPARWSPELLTAPSWSHLSSALGSVGRREPGRPAVGFRPPSLPQSPSSETPSESPAWVPAGLPATGPQFVHPRRGRGGVCNGFRVVPAVSASPEVVPPASPHGGRSCSPLSR